MTLAVIPARGGSKRIPRKNIRPFAGKPMIAFAIDAAMASGQFEHVVVSTDDAEIAEIARQRGAEVPFLRPKELSDDFTPTVPVIAHAIRACSDLGWNTDLTCCIYPGVPMIEANDLKVARARIEETGALYAFPVAQFPAAIQRALRRDVQSGMATPFNPEHVNTRTQDLEPAYFDAGQFYWGRRYAWLEGHSIHGNGATIVLPEWRVVDIDTPDDWARAELLYKALFD
jgi:pseudaminic acid cytidylyltransferase